ncbi:MAG TPA: 4Fe-4S binding protein [Clostridia bacterium]|nr:4Fe-4S binding protein [Clostridia bacterium]
MKKAVLNESRCDKSPFCAARRACPAEAIRFEKEGLFSGKITIDREKCIGCSKCVAYCPHGAISMK